MAAIEQNIPNMLGGVSQQPDPVKLPGQVRVADNVYLDPTFGCLKRPPTAFIDRLTSDLPASSLVKWFPIFRDELERYIGCIYQDATETSVVRVWDARSGVEKTVTIADEWQAYSQGSAGADFQTLTINDYTFISNPNRVVTSNKVEETLKEDSLVVIGSVAFNAIYTVDLGGVDGDQVGSTTATKLSVSPGSYETDNNPGEFTGTETFLVDEGDNTDLSFKLTVQGINFNDPDGDVHTRYNVQVTLYSGGEGWRKGDSVPVTLNGKQYRVTVEEHQTTLAYADLGSATYTTAATPDSGAASLDIIVSNLSESIRAIDGFNCEVVNNVMRIFRTDNAQFRTTTRGGTTNTSMSVINKTVADISELPPQCFNNYYLEVRNTEESDQDDYYVRFRTDVGSVSGPGTWEECAKVGDGANLNETTMPFALKRLASGDFSLGPLTEDDNLGTWADRNVGDAKSNPLPTFVGNTIRSMFLHRNRLGFVTEESVVLSQPGEFLNFFATSGITITDSDPIDLSASDLRPVGLQKAVSTRQGIVIIGEQAQFIMKTKEAVFSPNTVEMNKIGSYQYISKTVPVSTSVSVMFDTSAGNYTKVYEMATASLADNIQSSENTVAIPRYIPTDLQWSSNSDNNNLILYGDGVDVYTFRFLNEGDTRKVAGWTRWQFENDVEFAAAIGDEVYVIERVPTTDGSISILSRMVLLDGPEAPIDVGYTEFRPRCDRQINQADCTDLGQVQVEGLFYTLYELPEGYMSEDSITGIVAYTDVNSGDFEVVEVYSDRQFLVREGRQFIFGIQYKTLVEFPAFYTKLGDNQARADRISNPMIQMVYLNLYNSGSINVDVNVLGYPANRIELPLVKAGSYNAGGVVVIEDTTIPVPVYQLGENVDFTISSDTPFPTSVIGFSWQGTYNKRGYRRV